MDFVTSFAILLMPTCLPAVYNEKGAAAQCQLDIQLKFTANLVPSSFMLLLSLIDSVSVAGGGRERSVGD